MNKNIISGLYPTTKLLFVISMISLSLVYDWRFSYFVVLPLCIILALIDGKLIGFLKKVIVALTVFVVFIFIFQVLLDKSDTKLLFSIGTIKITEGALLAGLTQTKVLVALVATIMLFFETTEMEEFMYSLQKLNVSHVVTYVVLSTLQLIPDMGKKSTVIMQAQQARGIETEGSILNRMKAFFPSLGPLIISAITDVEDRSITLEVRGFSSENKKTSLKVINKKFIDKLLVYLVVLVTIGLIIWRFV